MSAADEYRKYQVVEMIESLMAIVDGKEVRAFFIQEDGTVVKNPEVPEDATFKWKGENAE